MYNELQIKIQELARHLGANEGELWDELQPILEEVDTNARKEEHRFFLNVLDGIDAADAMWNGKAGGTKAIRFALKNRVI